MNGGNASSLSANKDHSIKMDGGVVLGATISYQGSMEMNGGYVKSIHTFHNAGGSAIDITGGTIDRLTIEGDDQTTNLAIATITDDPLTDDLIFKEYIRVGYEGIVHMDGGSFENNAFLKVNQNGKITLYGEAFKDSSGNSIADDTNLRTLAGIPITNGYYNSTVQIKWHGASSFITVPFYIDADTTNYDAQIIVDTDGTMP